MRAGEIYSKLMDRYLELNKKAVETLDEEDWIYQRGFREATRMVYELVMSEADDCLLKVEEGDEDA